MNRLVKVDIWKNRCGATVGKSVIQFTGLRNDKNQEGIYITLKYPVWHCPNLIWINSHSPTNLRKAIKEAYSLKKVN